MFNTYPATPSIILDGEKIQCIALHLLDNVF